MILLLWLACAGDDVDPAELCREEGGAECCSNDDCGADEICFTVYTCATRSGAFTCTEPTGDNTCHSLCEDPEGDDCTAADETCQAFDFAQGEDYYEELTACF